MEFLTYVYLSYTFIAFYFLFVHILAYVQNKHAMYNAPEPEREYSLSIVVPCFNEGESIGKNIESLINSDYKGLRKIIVVDDCSTDNSYEIIKTYEKKYPGKVIAVQTPKNTGCAAGSKNYGAKFVDTELIGFSDADSFAKEDAISKMIGYFNDLQVGAVTSRVLVSKKNKNRLTKVQAIEYKIIAFTRKLLCFLDSVYVTNGPLSIYRRNAFDQVNGFDETNLTEDIEITWNFVSKGWKVRMSIPAEVSTDVPHKIGPWFRQRVRWNVGGFQTVSKYKKKIMSTGMLGYFIMPFFIFSWLLGVVGLFFLAYRIFNFIFVRYLITKYSLAADVPLISSSEIILTPDVLFFFGIALFSLGLIFTLLGLSYSREKDFKHPIHDIFIYSIFYLLAYPPLLIYSLYKFFRGYGKW